MPGVRDVAERQRRVGGTTGRRRGVAGGALALLAAAALTACTGSTSGDGGTGSATGSAGASASRSPSPSPSSSSAGANGPAVALETAYRHVIGTVLPSVVEIRTQQALGSGVVFDDKGHVVTNAHVVGDATSFTVFLPGRAKPVDAKLTGVYAPDDLAVIQLADASAARAATFGRSADLKVGDIVLAMGNPLGLASSVTNGIVSALGRTVPEPQGKDSPGAGQPTPTTEALSVALAAQQVGASVPVQVLRDGSTRTVQVTLGELKAP